MEILDREVRRSRQPVVAASLYPLADCARLQLNNDFQCRCQHSNKIGVLLPILTAIESLQDCFHEVSDTQSLTTHTFEVLRIGRRDIHAMRGGRHPLVALWRVRKGLR